jgi:hypothetical protein
MASDPRFDDFPDSMTETQQRRSKWTSCLIGCLIVMGGILVLAIVLAVWLSRNWQDLAADLGTQAVNQVLESSELPPQEKGEVRSEVNRVAKALQERKISGQQARAVIEKILESPLMPTMIVAVVDRQYLERSGLSDAEKLEGRKSLSRFARGVIDKKIDQQGMDAVMSHVADRQANGQWQLREQISDDELRAALTAAKEEADKAAIPDEPEAVDPSDELKRIIDESLPGA